MTWKRRPPCGRLRVPRGLPVGQGCLRSRHSALSPRSLLELPLAGECSVAGWRALAASTDWQPAGASLMPWQERLGI